TYYALRSFLIQRLDQQLAPIAQANESRLGPCLSSPIVNCPFNTPTDFRAPLTEWLAVLSADGTPAAEGSNESESLRDMSLSKPQREALAANPVSFHTITATDGVQLRIVARQMSLPTGTFVVVSGLSTGEVHKTLGRLIAIEVIIGGSAVVLAL